MLNRLLIASVAVIALTFFITSARSADDTTSLEGKAAPDFSLTTIDGKDVKLSDMKGKVVMIDFWATWCPPCRKSLPHLQSVATNKEMADKGLVVWAVNAREVKDKVQKYLDDNKLTFTVPMDEGKTMTAYKVQGIPTTIIVGRDGNIKNVFVGFGEGSEKPMDDAVNAALAEKK
jgi:cytochrome c biogenesis protein CcmG/thiol:disulfide interchange protein DsbE